MAVPEQIPYVGYTANGVANEFAINFDLHDPQFLIVTLNKEIPILGGYTVDILNQKVIFGVAPTAGDQVEFYRDTKLDRVTEYKSYDNSFRPEALNWDLDKIWMTLQEQNLIDSKILARLKSEIEWRRTHDFNYDELAQVREKQLFDALKGYSETLLASTSPGIFQGVIAGVVFAQDGKSVQTHIEETVLALIELRAEIESLESGTTQAVNAETERAIAAEQQETEARQSADALLQAQVNANGIGNRSYLTYAEMDADKLNIPAKSKVTITNDGSNNGDWNWDGVIFTKSDYDPLTQAKADATAKANAAEANAKLYTDSITTNVSSADFSESGYISASGVLLSSASFKSTGFIKVVPGQGYRIFSQIAVAARHAWYDKNQVFISAFGDDQTTLTEKTYAAPTNAAYLRVSAYLAAAWNVAYIKSKTYSIDVIQKIIQQHMPNVDSSKIDYSSSNVKATLDTVISKQNSIIANQNLGLNQLDIITDDTSPYFVNTSQYVRSVGTPANFNAVNILSRVSDTQMTVSDASAFSKNVSFVVYDNVANKYTSHSALDIAGSTITVFPALPANPSQAQTMHDSYEGQHLSLFGYRGLADFIVDSIQKYSYKKTDNLIFNFNPSKYVKQSNSQGQITSDGSDVKIQVFYIGTAKTGGLISGTNLAKICDLSDELNIGDGANTQYLSKSYILKDSIAGNGYEINFDAKASDGFVKIPLAVRNEVYTSSADNQTYRTSGRVRLQVLNGATVIHDAVYAAGQVHHIDVDFTAADNIKIRVTCEASVPTSSLLSGIFAYRKSPKTSKERIFQAGDVVAFLGDSWTQYPKAPNNLGAIRPDGSQSDGIQELSVRMKNRLDVLGIPSTMLNMGFGGQTSRWGKYWMYKIAQLNPKPNFCVINFGINDLNSVAKPSNNFYDFDPVNMFLNKLETSGGINGKISSYAEWEQNLISICNYMISKGIKPILLMPTQTASVSQSQGARLYQLNRIASGFN